MTGTAAATKSPDGDHVVCITLTHFIMLKLSLLNHKTAEVLVKVTERTLTPCYSAGTYEN